MSRLRQFLLIGLSVLVTSILIIPPVRASGITFTESSDHHKPVIKWGVGGDQPTYAYACGYHSTTPSEEDLHFRADPNPPYVHPTCYWGVEATKVTVSFPDTPDPSVIRVDNWLAAGMFATGFDHTVEDQDWAYYAVIVLDPEGNLWLDVGIYADNEGNGMYYGICAKTWQISGLTRETPITLVAGWIGDTVEWNVTIAGVTYDPPDSSFFMGDQNDPIKSCIVGWSNIFPQNAPYDVCYYFQFGIMSPLDITQSGWNALLEHPQWYGDGGWHVVQQAQTMQGTNSNLDSTWRWGGRYARVEVKCHSNDASMERYKVKFFYSAEGTANNYHLWSHEPNTPPMLVGNPFNYETYYSLYCARTTDPEGTQLKYRIDWDDGSQTTTRLVSSGEPLGVLHAWSYAGIYDVRVCAFDSDEAQSDWSPALRVTIASHGGGGCPYVAIWNGTRYILENNILPTSGRSNGTDVEDYYRLEGVLLPREGQYSLLIDEFEHERSSIDQVRFLAVDHDSNVKIAVGQNDQILTFKNPVTPESAIDNCGVNRLSEIRLVDGDVSNPDTFFYGNASDYLVLNFGRVSSDNAKLILRDDQKCELCCIDVQVLNSAGQWRTVATVAPRNYWAVEGVDLSRYVVRNRDFKVRLLWTSPHKLDYAGMDTSRHADYQITYASLVSATHSTQGDVTSLLVANDNQYAELIPGQQILLDFALPDNQQEARTYILYTEGYYITIP